MYLAQPASAGFSVTADLKVGTTRPHQRGCRAWGPGVSAGLQAVAYLTGKATFSACPTYQGRSQARLACD